MPIYTGTKISYTERQAEKISHMFSKNNMSVPLADISHVINYFCKVADSKDIHYTRSYCGVFYKLVKLFAMENSVDERGFYEIAYPLKSLSDSFGIHINHLQACLSCYVACGLIEKTIVNQNHRPYRLSHYFMDLSPFFLTEEEVVEE